MKNKKNLLLLSGIILSALLISCPGTATEVDETASYKIEHYQQNIENDEYTIVSEDTQTFEDTAGETTNAKAKTYEGFTAKSFEQKTIKADNSTVIKIYYDRKNIVYTFSASDGSWNGVKEKIVQGRFGAKVKLPEHPELDLYTFSGWDYEVPQTFGIYNHNFSAKWTLKTQYKYKIEHYKQNISGIGYTLEFTGTGYLGYENELTTATPGSYEGFTVKTPIKQETISADNNTVVKIYYDRITTTYTFLVDNAAWKTISGLYGADVAEEIEDPVKDGFTFDGWSEKIPAYFGSKDISFTATWQTKTEPVITQANYKVEHWLQNIDDDEYTLEKNDTKTLKGTIGQSTVAERNIYIGFDLKPFDQETINKDGTTVVKIYYDRRIIKYTFNADTGHWNENESTKIIEGKYGSNVSLPTDPERTGYEFVAWDKDIPTVFDTVFITTKATWSINKYAISFVTNCDKSLQSQIIEYNSKVTKPQDFERQYYSLEWYSDEAFTKLYDFDTPVTKSFSLYAKWQYEGKIVSNGIMIDGVVFEKTSEVEITNQTVTVAAETPDFIPEDPRADKYEAYRYIGSFAEKSETIKPFIMGKYAVTQELYNAVISKTNIEETSLESNPSVCSKNNNYPLVEGEVQKLHPVDGINWFDAVYFCNKLSELTGGLTNAYTISDIIIQNGHIKSATVTSNDNATGYRLPTSAEWEFAARGGDSSKPEWEYLFAGNPSNQDDSPLKDSGIDAVGWYRHNSGNCGITGEADVQQKKPGYGTHEVGLKKPNSLGLYDMSGNIYEWCNDLDQNSSDGHIIRGGCWHNYTIECSTCFIGQGYQSNTVDWIGFRVVRSINSED